ncbi:MAG TPA: acyclic terpene utilization AtuA family protein, partial [Candidatus Elarobacter sp.]|nr:acyclic terpene utilization AtuA family protein [Candidatus Elarobacter sp.]
MNERTVRIGGFSAFWGDSDGYAEQLVNSGGVDFLIGDYLAEITMSLLARAKAKDPNAGYATDVVGALAPLLGELQARNIGVVTNAGGLNPRAAREALLAAARERGLAPRIAIVAGDDLMPHLSRVRALQPREIGSGAALPAQLVSANAYLGAIPIARALDAGAQIVLCGRVVDSALTLGVLMHAFTWRADDYDRLAAGSLAGHVIECAAQATGGLFTDWRAVPGWDDMGVPIATCSDDGSFVISKPDGTGGLVSRATVAEQIVYEIGDPAAYVLPDVTCDFSDVRIEDLGGDRVRVSAARGRAPTAAYKVSATYLDGYRIAATMLIAGGEAAARAERAGHAILARAARIAVARGFAPFAETSVEVAGGGAIVGRPELAAAAREVVLKLAARHAERAPLDVLAREIAPAGCAMAQGFTGLIGGRPKATPVIRLFSFLIDKRVVEALVELDGEPLSGECAPEDERAGTARDALVAQRSQGGAPFDKLRVTERFGVTAETLGLTETLRVTETPHGTELTQVPLRAIAWGRSGDKGDACNIGIIARHPAFAALIAEQFSAERVAARFAYVARGPVT